MDQVIAQKLSELTLAEDDHHDGDRPRVKAAQVGFPAVVGPVAHIYQHVAEPNAPLDVLDEAAQYVEARAGAELAGLLRRFGGGSAAEYTNWLYLRKLMKSSGTCSLMKSPSDVSFSRLCL